MLAKSIRICFAMLLLLSLGVTGQSRPHGAKPEVTALIAALPDCSALRQRLVRGDVGDGIDKPYMKAMLREGVERAYIEVHGVWKHNRPANMEVVRGLYFNKLDAPHSEITDSAKLKQLRDSGLERLLDSVVLLRINEAHLMGWHDPQPIWNLSWQLHGSKISGSIDLFDTPWVPDSGRPVFRDFHPQPSIEQAAGIGDVMRVRTMLGQRKYSQAELDRALSHAAMSVWDNTDVIELLVKADADPNARFGENTTVLMLAYENACNIRPLLDQGARPNDRDKWGRTALDLAKQRHDDAAIALLEQPASTQ